MSENRTLLALLAIMLLGTVLRFYGLGFQSLWGDELASWDLSTRETISQVIGGVRDDIGPPLYFLILRFAQWIFGDAEWALRFPSAFAGWLCIPAIYLLGKRLYSEREGLIAALFRTVLWAPVYFSQEARAYSMLILLSILTTCFWWSLMLGLRYRRDLQAREAALYVTGHEDKYTLVVRCDTGNRLDYYLKTREKGARDDVQACEASDFPKIENKVKEGDYKEVFNFISHEDPDQQMVSKFQRSLQPVQYERFDGAALIVYKVRPSVPTGFPQPEPPNSLPKQE